MTMGMQVRLAETRDQVPLSGEQWNSLAARSPAHTAFQTFEWFDSWWTAFGAGHQLFLLTVHDGESVIGIMPLMLLKGPMGLRQLEFTGSPNADYQDLILVGHRAAVIAAICGFLKSARGRWDMIVLRNLRADSPTASELTSEFGRLGFGVMDMERQPCPALLVRGRESEIRQLLSRYSIRRSLKRLEERGPVSFRLLDTPEEIDRYLPVFFDQHINRWQDTKAPSPFGDARFCDWYRALAQAAHAAGWLHFSVLECAGAPVAFHFGFCHGGTLAWYKPSFNPDFNRESPGTVLIRYLIEDARQRGLDELDFSGGMEAFKSRFSNVERVNLNLRIFSRPLLHRSFVAGAWLRGIARTAWHLRRGDRTPIRLGN